MDKTIQTVRGVKFPKIPDLSLKSIEFALNYQPGHGDRILMTYPKSGTRWTSYIVLSIMGLTNINGDTYKNLWLESSGWTRIMDKKSMTNVDRDVGNCAFLTTNTSFTSMAYSPDAKYLIVLRNPKDVCVSYYYFAKHVFQSDLDFHDYFKRWITGEDVPYGDYFEAIQSYWEHRMDGNCTLITYEEMLANPRDSIVRIASFLGTKYVDRLYDRCDDGGDGVGSNGDTLLDRIERESGFKAMKSSHPSGDKHFRKGIAGDWRAVMSRDESDLIDKRVRDEWMGTGLESLWERDMKW
jgi:hypothetical protein